MMPIILLSIVPIVNGAINCLLRQMKDLNEYSSTTYLFLVTTTMTGIALPIFEKNISIFYSFTISDYSMILASAILGVLAMVVKTKAF